MSVGRNGTRADNSTPLLEIEVVDVDTGKRPRFGRAGIRFLVQCGPTCLGIGAIETIDVMGFARSGVAEILAGIIVGVVTAGVPLFLGIAGQGGMTRLVNDRI